MAEATQALDYATVDIQEGQNPGPPVWGRLVSLDKRHPDIDLVDRQVVLGRQSTCNIKLDEPAVSGRHCRLTLEDDGAVLVEDMSSNGTFLNQEKIGKGNKRVLQFGAELAILFKATSTSATLAYRFERALAETQDQKNETPFSRKYDMGNTQLGTGSFAVVKLGIEKVTGKRVAIKEIDKKRFASIAAARKDKILEEAEIMQRMDHEFIVKVFDCFDSEKTLYIVLELMTGGNLEDYIMEHGPLEEGYARKLFSQAAQALLYLHSNGVAHRDMKPENLLLRDKSHDCIKITDFGLSKVIDDGKFTKTICGTPKYIAPEILAQTQTNTGYGKSVDIWSMGCILYYMLCGVAPFSEATDSMSVYQLISSGKYDTSIPQFVSLSATAKDLVSRLLVVDPTHRLTAAHMLQHPWVDGKSEIPDGFPPPGWEDVQSTPELQRKRTQTAAEEGSPPSLKRQRTEPMADDAASGSEAPQQDARPACKYGKDCYRKNPQHFLDFYHPHLEKRQ